LPKLQFTAGPGLAHHPLTGELTAAGQRTQPWQVTAATGGYVAHVTATDTNGQFKTASLEYALQSNPEGAGLVPAPDWITSHAARHEA